MLCPTCLRPAGASGAGAEGRIKGDPVWAFTGATTPGLSRPIDISGFNALSVEVLLSGTNPSVDLRILGSVDGRSVFLPLPDPNATRLGITQNLLFDVVAGPAWVQVEIMAISGTFGGGQGVSILLSPYVSPGQTRVDATVSGTVTAGGVAMQTLAQAAVAVPSGVWTPVVGSNPQRQYLLLINDSPVDVYLRLGGSTFPTAVRLNRFGGALEMRLDAYNLYRGPVYAYQASGQNATVLVLEGSP